MGGDKRLSAQALDCIAELGPGNIIVVGEADDASLQVADNLGFATGITSLASDRAVIEWLAAHNLPVEYLAVVNPSDRIRGAARKLSMAAPAQAA